MQSRIKALDKHGVGRDLPEARRDAVLVPADRALRVNEVVRIEGLRKAYGEHVVFPGVDLTVRRGEKIGIIGVNGAGKTTLLRMIAGELPHDAGTIRLGSGVEVGYYAQHHADTLDLGATVYEVVQRAAPETPPARVRSILGAFMFSGDDVDKPVKVLSGGEKARVALARLLVAPGNLLLMDEPTNHLDLASSESLAASLGDVRRHAGVRQPQPQPDPHAGDQDLERRGPAGRDLPRHARRVHVLDGAAPDRGRDRRRTAPRRDPRGAVPAATAAASAKSRDDDKARKRREAEARQKRSVKLGPLEKQVAQLEDRIGALEAEQKARSAELADPTVYDEAARRNQLLSEYQAASDKLEELTARWEAAMAALEAAKAELGGTV